ncbi:proton-conducting transporter transmembrane domain-containing protein [Mycolicibacterium lacusdiani]|uniref:proton-conducting transporter transmembrane domain-containing protein n=1 Tax=Mycolicibacterium lacusdiani TaxID=2895283 RepID=UPI001F375C3B|nr:proton-conducting transporter membrane subunit [Mycolicibacterium lacusdiani]
MLQPDTMALAALMTAPLLAAISAAILGRRVPALTAGIGTLAAGLGFFVAALLAITSADGDAARLDAGAFSMTADRLALALLLLIFGVSAVAQAFAMRYMTGDPRAGWFTGCAGLLTAGSAMLATATTLVGLAAAWTLAGIALCLLLGTYWQMANARDGVRRTAIAFSIGDGALWVAVGLSATQTKSIDLADLRTAPIGGAMAAVMTLLIVVAALSRSAQIPFHRWLPATLTAPTPVSAMLHAGVVNAGGILLIKSSPLPSPTLAAALAVIAGVTTLAYGATITLVKPDVKGALAYSTMAQMGFMILTCGLGLWAAALMHLFAHGFYKATLFLSSGSAIARHHRTAGMPALRRLGRRKPVAIVIAATVPLASIYAAITVVPYAAGGHIAEQAILLFAWATGATLTWGWLQRRPDMGGVLSAAAVLVPAAIAYLALVSAVTHFLAPALPPASVPAPAVWAVIAVTAVALGLLAGVRLSPRARPLQRALYAYALSAGTIRSATTGPQ